MSIVTLQVGQAGCQGGAALFQLLAEEAGLAPAVAGAGGAGGDDWSEAADRFFYLASAGGQTRPTARAVLLDMEPKVVAASQQAALRSGSWQYSRAAVLGRQAGGSGNNWAAGALRHAPAVRQQVVGMLQRQVERCDCFDGFLVMQSAAGGTGSGLGSAMTQALREEFPSCRILNHCVWPFECGEVVTQPYNCLLTLSSLTQHSDGVVLAENEALAATCQRQLGIQRPDYADLNAVAALGLASVLLPCTLQRAPSTAAAGGSGGLGRGRGACNRRGRPEWDSGGPPLNMPAPAAAGEAWDGTVGSGSRWSDGEEEAGQRGGSSGSRLDPLGEVCDKLCSQPGYRLLSLRSCPQLPPSSFDFTPFNWPSVLKDLRQMQQAGRSVEAAAFAAASSTGSGGRPLGRAGSSGSFAGAGGGGRLGSNKALASLVVLRGDGARSADASCFAGPELYSSSSSTIVGQRGGGPLAVAASGSRLCKQQMLATLLSCDQAAAAPVSRILDRASQQYEARAYVHHYQKHGLSCLDFEHAFEWVEGVVERYAAL